MDFLEKLWFGFTTAMKGAPLTIGVSILAVVIGLILGFGLAMMRRSKIGIFRLISGVYIDVIRGTPMVVQALIFAYGVPQLLQKNGVPFSCTRYWRLSETRRRPLSHGFCAVAVMTKEPAKASAAMMILFMVDAVVK